MIARYLTLETTLITNEELQPWVDALRAIDEKDDNAPLAKLLKSKRPIPPRARLYLANLLERKKLRNWKRPPTPLYKFSDRVSKLLRAVEAVRYLLKDGATRDAAIKKAAAQYKLSPDAVRSAYEGRDRGLRAMVKNRPHLKDSFRRPPA